MATTTIRINATTRETLRQLAARSGRSMQEVLEAAIEEHRRRQFFADVNAAYEALRRDPAEWEVELAERRLTEGTLADGIATES